MNKRQTTSELGRTTVGKWSKSEKREAATRSIMEAKKRTHAINKRFAQQQRMQ